MNWSTLPKLRYCKFWILSKILKKLEFINFLGDFRMTRAKAQAKPISFLHNFPISSGILPDACKLKPVWKIVKTWSFKLQTDFLLLFIPGTFKKVIHDQTATWFDRKMFLCNYQSGFRKNVSTHLCLSAIINLDLEKMFQRISVCLI